MINSKTRYHNRYLRNSHKHSNNQKWLPWIDQSLITAGNSVSLELKEGLDSIPRVQTASSGLEGWIWISHRFPVGRGRSVKSPSGAGSEAVAAMVIKADQ